MKSCVIFEHVNPEPPETGITRKLRVMLALQKYKNVDSFHFSVYHAMLQ